MRLHSIAALALVATAMADPSPVSAQACVQDEYGRVVCGLVADPYPNGWSYDQYGHPGWLYGFCPPGTVAGNYACIPWRAYIGSKCPPNMTLRDGFCRRYSDRY